MTPPSAGKVSKLDQAEAASAKRVQNAQKNSSARIAMAALPDLAPAVVDTPPEPITVLEVVEPVVEQSLVAVPASKKVKQAKAGTVPSWRSLATPPAARGTGGNQRRLNVPCSPETMRLLNTRDRELLESGARWRVNRSALLSEAIDVLHHDAAPWVERWEQARLEEEPYTTSLQGRVDDEHFKRYSLLRYLDDGRTVSAGPLLSLVIKDILQR